MSSFAANGGRILIAALFVVSGIGKILDPAQAARMIEAHTSLPGSLAMFSGIFELALGLILMTGFMNLLASLVLIVFTVLTTLLFHSDFTDPTQAALALKNLAVVGGLMTVYALSQTRGRLGVLRERERQHESDAQGTGHNERLAAG